MYCPFAKATKLQGPSDPAASWGEVPSLGNQNVGTYIAQAAPGKRE